MLGGQQRERVGGKQGDERGGAWGGVRFLCNGFILWLLKNQNTHS